jgi:hypothetical protein
MATTERMRKTDHFFQLVYKYLPEQRKADIVTDEPTGSDARRFIYD